MINADRLPYTRASKITAPKSADQYFEDTEHAVKHAYAGLASCWRHAEQAHKDMPRLKRSLASYEKYFELKISEAMFAGSILEAAYMAIRLYSPNKPIPSGCAKFACLNLPADFVLEKSTTVF